jgi:cyclopropane fatty-acyl-phospholipid synthase-like methyltransferase
MSGTTSDPTGHHDWHSAAYVDDWISQDFTRDEERRPVLRQLARLLELPRDRPVRVLDVGGGYGMLSGEVLGEWPDATIVLHDFSRPMFEHAEQRLAGFADRLSFHPGDLRDPSWTQGLAGPFDAVVSALAIHNVRDPAVIRRVHRDIFGLLAADGRFLDVDIMRAPTSPEAHVRWLLDAGFERAAILWTDATQTMIGAFRA